jgi:rfaE bifunctional protein kinase chain/domain/rfaE bifunctional protein nucleotidyltransferase chain/domain
LKGPDIVATTDSSSSNRDKIFEVDRLAPVLRDVRATGKRVVLCHGVFDLLHVGHIRYFEAAKREGDVLVVTVTEDAHVNKGPHRPAFTESLRAEALAALADVDYVAVSRNATAVKAIEALRPDVYFKGSDYKNAADDVSGGIVLEERAVEEAGGRLVYAQTEMFSSTHLLNRFVPSFPPEVEAYLADFRTKYTAADVVGWLDKLRDMRAVVAGEAILDEYVYVDQMGKSAKEPILAMRFSHTEIYPGGSLAVANHLASFCASVELVSYLGANDAHEQFIRSHLKPNVRSNFIYKSNSPTIAKRRYVEKTLFTKLFEVYVINDELIEEAEERQLCELLEARIEKTDCIVAADFGHGLMTPKAISLLADSDKFLAVNTQINAANIRFHAISKYKRADYVCINEGELRLDARSRTEPLAELIEGLHGKLRCNRFLVTQGRAGVAYFEGDREIDAPAFATSAVDRIGSGDALLAVTSLCVAAGVPGEVTAFLANVIGAQKVQIMGNRSAVDRVATVKFVQALLK